MIKHSLALFIGLRYTRAKRRNHFISFIAMTSMMGIALGVMVLITVLSVMNGFDEEISKQVFGIAQHITVNTLEGRLNNWKKWQQQLSRVQGVLASAPYINGQTLLSFQGHVSPALLMGVLPDAEKKASELTEKMVVGKLEQLKAGQYGVILGEELAHTLDINLGDKVTIITSHVNITPFGMTPQFKRFTVMGFFHVGGGFRFDSSLAFVHLNDAQRLLGLNNAVTGIHLKIQELFKAPQLSHLIARDLPENYRVYNWTQQFGDFFQAIKLEKNMMFFILVLIIAVAAFNLVSSLVMVVNEKRADIAILRTMGATPNLILKIFMIQGFIIGLIGTALGLGFGVLLAKNVTQVVHFIESLLNTRFISADIYFIDYLPSKLLTSDVIKVTATAMLMSLMATIYPAWRASKTEPAEALRYE